MNIKDWLYIVFIVALLGVGVYRYQHRTYTDSQTKIVMDTFTEISVTSKSKNVNALIGNAFSLIQSYNDKFNYFDSSSALSKINNSIKDSIPIDPELLEMFELAGELNQKSNGLYDVSVGTLTDIWRYDRAHVPSSDSIKMALQNVGFNRILISNNYLTKPLGVKINLGSIAKGYIVDKAMEYLQKNGAVSGFVNAGGNIRTFGFTKNNSVGIVHPRKKDSLIGEIKIKNGGVATSGDYERYFEVKGKRYHHILNPKTGMPSEGTMSVTIIAPTATLADGLSTTLFVMEHKKAIELLEQFPGTEAIIFYEEKGKIKSIQSKNFSKYMVKLYE